MSGDVPALAGLAPAGLGAAPARGGRGPRHAGPFGTALAAEEPAAVAAAGSRRRPGPAGVAPPEADAGRPDRGGGPGLVPAEGADARLPAPVLANLPALADPPAADLPLPADPGAGGGKGVPDRQPTAVTTRFDRAGAAGPSTPPGPGGDRAGMPVAAGLARRAGPEGPASADRLAPARLAPPRGDEAAEPARPAKEVTVSAGPPAARPDARRTPAGVSAADGPAGTRTGGRVTAPPPDPGRPAGAVPADPARPADLAIRLDAGGRQLSLAVRDGALAGRLAATADQLRGDLAAVGTEVDAIRVAHLGPALTDTGEGPGRVWGDKRFASLRDSAGLGGIGRDSDVKPAG